jgi:Cu(I)/Ag(I) efflux system membrane fusion protein
MNSRERKFLVSGIGAGLLAGAVTLGAFVASDAQHTVRHAHRESATSQTPTASSSASGDADNVVSAIKLSSDEINAAGVQIAEVHLAKLKTDVDAFGRVEQPEAQLSVIPARVGGRIDRLHVQYTGEKVFRGQAVAEIYSPDAASAIEEYRLAVQSRDRLGSARPEAIQQADDLIKASRSRLELWGISDKQIDLSGTVTRITVYAPSGGTVVERKVARGQYVNAGETLFALADLNTVWVKAEVYESQLPQIRAGQAVELRSDALPNQVVHGKVEFIEPKADPQTRTIPVHVHVANPGMKLVPGMYVRALFTSVAAKDAIVVPRSAVLDTGTRTLVYVVNGESSYEARDVEIGAAASGDLYPVLRGLKPGERVVTDGNFLIDSQTRLSGGMTGLFGGSKEFQKEANGSNGKGQNQPSAKITLSTNPDPPKGAADATFSVTLLDREGKPIPDATVKVTLVMPAMPAMNMPEMRNSFELPWMAAHGMYMGQGNIPTAGPWNMTVEATRNGSVIATYRTRLSAR